MEKFNEAVKRHLSKLELFVPVVQRVHGGSHPEFHDVSKLFNEISAKINKAGTEEPDLVNEFKKLREITNSYTVPGDVCESYEAVYNMLAELDEAYQT